MLVCLQALMKDVASRDAAIDVREKQLSELATRERVYASDTFQSPYIRTLFDTITSAHMNAKCNL